MTFVLPSEKYWFLLNGGKILAMDTDRERLERFAKDILWGDGWKIVEQGNVKQ